MLVNALDWLLCRLGGRKSENVNDTLKVNHPDHYSHKFMKNINLWEAER
jgi:hypothetical protein